MSGFQVVRGTAEIPQLEQRFEAAFGRPMSVQERRFFGLHEEDEPQIPESRESEYAQSSKAA